MFWNKSNRSSRMLTRMATATGLKNFSHSEAYDFTKSRIGKPMTSQCVSQNLGRNARASGNRPVPLWHNPENVNSVRLKQWFLTGEELLPTGGVNKFINFQSGASPYVLCNMEGLSNCLPINTFLFTTYLMPGGGD